MKPHQINALFFIAGLLFGALLHYVLFSGTVSYKVEQAYEQGVKFGEWNNQCQVIENFNQYSSFRVYPDRIEWYNEQETSTTK